MKKNNDVLVSTTIKGQLVVLAGAQVQVQNFPSGTPAVIYGTNVVGTPISSTLTVAPDGTFSFYAPDGHYQYQVTPIGYATYFIYDVIFEDLVDELAASSGSSLVGDQPINGATTTVGAALRVIEADIAPPPFFNLTPNVATVVVAPYTPTLPVASGAANFGPSAGEASLEFINLGHLLRIRQTGSITQIKIYIPSLTGMTGFYLKLWRLDKDGVTYDQVGISENLFSSLVAGQINTIILATPIPAQIGDYIGGRVTYSSASVQNLFMSSVANTTLAELGAVLYSVTNAIPTTPQYNWAGQTATNSKAVLIECDMGIAPVLVSIGDSITSGLRESASFMDNYQLLWVPNAGYPDQIAAVLGYTFQNAGIGGQTTTQMAARFTTDVVNLSPKVVTILGGVNDIINSVSNTTIIANVTSMLNAAKAAGIVPIVIGVTPFAKYALATLAMAQQRDLLNTLLQALVTSPTYNGYYINPDPYLGTYDSTGPAGNLWDMNPIYSSFGAGADLLHPNTIGDYQISSAVLSQSSLQTALNKILSGYVPVVRAGKLLVNLDGFGAANDNFGIGYGYPQTDTSNHRLGALAQSNDSTNPFVLLVEAIGAATAALRTVILQTAQDGLSNGGVLALNPAGGMVLIGNVLAANIRSGSVFVVGSNWAQTDVTLRRVGMLAQSTDTTNPFGLSLSVTGAATAALRTVILQTAQDGLSNSGVLSLQPSGGTLLASNLYISTVSFANIAIFTNTGNNSTPYLVGVSQNSISIQDQFGSDATTAGFGINVANSTKAASFTMSDYYGLRLAAITINAGSAVTNKWGVYQSDAGAANLFAGMINETSKTVTSTNSLTTYSATTQYNYLTGTAGASLAVTLPAGSAVIDGQKRIIMSTATRVSTTWISSGATFVGAPATLTANTPVVLHYDQATTIWYISA